MSDSKSYYYLKMKENFYERDEIKAIESMPSGHEFVNILLKMYLRSLKRGGKLMVTDKIPYDAPMLANALGHKQETVEKAVALFQRFGLIEITDSYEIYLTEIQNFIGQSSTEADRIREYRAGIKSGGVKTLPAPPLPDENTTSSGDNSCKTQNNNKSSTNVQQKNTITKDIAKDIHRDNIKKEKPEKHKYGLQENVLLTDEEKARFDEEFGADFMAKVFDFYSSYKVEKDYKSKSDNLSIRRWVIKAVKERVGAGKGPPLKVATRTAILDMEEA